MTAAAGYIGLGAYFDGENSAKLRLRQSQPLVMRFLKEVRARASSYHFLSEQCTGCLQHAVLSLPGTVSSTHLWQMLLQARYMHTLNGAVSSAKQNL